ncbi:MAG: DUF1697 domain-containing protein [Chloroflexota bacterium]
MGVAVKYIALVRGINVGGYKKVSMADLREVLTSLGHTDVSTYIQTGNAIFTSPREDREQLTAEIQERVARDVGLDIVVMLWTPEELGKVIGANPFPDATATPARLFVCFLSAPVDEATQSVLEPGRFAPDEFRFVDRVMYILCPNGAAESRLTNDLLERRLGVRATSRNWKTVTALYNRAMGDSASL